MEEENLQSQINELKTQIEELKKGYNEHLHTGLDGTDVLKKSIKLENDQFLTVGLASMATAPIDNSKLGNTDEQIQFSIGVGQDDGQTGFLNKVKNMQLNFLHQPNNTSKHSFIDASRDAVVGSISVTSGQNTATITGYNFITNELAGAIINIIGSSGLVESKIIASNTSTQITITSTWVESTNGDFEIFFPVYLGSANRPYARNYVTEGTGGGIRFGIGKTCQVVLAWSNTATYSAGAIVSYGGSWYISLKNGNYDNPPDSYPEYWGTTTTGFQNGLLHSDSNGDLYWIKKNGTSTKLN